MFPPARICALDFFRGRSDVFDDCCDHDHDAMPVSAIHRSKAAGNQYPALLHVSW